MNCTNCGAPMMLIRQQDCFVCEYCGSFHFPSPSQDGIRVLGREADAVQCPVCRVTLSAAVIDHWPGWHCGVCRGVLMEQDHLRVVVEYRRARAAGPPHPPTPLNRKDLQRRVRCPRCGRWMDTHPYYGPGNFVIDNCPRCALVWLDHGELHRATHAPGRDRKRRA